MLQAGITFHNSFNSIKPLQNCEVILRQPDYTLLLDKNNIVKYTTRATNNYLCSPYPTEQTTIEIIGWSALSSTIKTYLSTIDNEIHIYYKVNGYATLQPRVCFVDKLEVDYKQQKATLKCVSIMERKAMTNMGWYILFNGATISSIFDQFTKIKDTTITKVVSVVNDTTTENVWFDKTNGENIQNCAIACGGTFKVYYDAQQNKWYKTIVEMPSTPSIVNYDVLNIYDDISVKEESINPTSYVFGYKLGEEEEITEYVLIMAQTSFDTNREVPLGYLITDYIRNGNLHATTIKTEYNSSGNQLYCYAIGHFDNNTITTAYMTIKGKKFILPSVQGENSYTNILAKLVDNTNTTQKGIIKANADRYLALNKTISFSCRLNPCFEPLDFLSFANIGGVIIEEIELVYNGGFRGTIKGKLDLTDYYPDPILIDRDVSDEDNWFFTIANKSYRPKNLQVYTSGSVVPHIFRLDGNTTIKLTKTNAPFLQDSITHYVDAHLTLEDDVYANFEDVESGQTTYSIILLEAEV